MAIIFEEEFTKLDLVTPANPNGLWAATDNWQTPQTAGYQDFGTPTTYDVNPNESLGGQLRSMFAIDANGLTLSAMHMPSSWGKPQAIAGCILISNTNIHTFGYGYYEFDFSLPNHGKGMFPSIWMYAAHGKNDGPNKGGAEIDLFEIFGFPNAVPWNSTLHTAPNGGSGSVIGDDILVNQSSIPLTGEHLIALDWTANYMHLFLDGNQVGAADAPHVAWFAGCQMDVRFNYTMDATWFASGNISDSTTPSPLMMYIHRFSAYDAMPTSTTIPIIGQPVANTNPTSTQLAAAAKTVADATTADNDAAAALLAATTAKAATAQTLADAKAEQTAIAAGGTTTTTTTTTTPTSTTPSADGASIKTGDTGALIDNAGNSYTLVNAKFVVNGKVTAGNNVVQLLKVRGSVDQLNASGQWWTAPPDGSFGNYLGTVTPT